MGRRDITLTTIAILCIAGAIISATIFMGGDGGTPAEQAWFYDINTGELVSLTERTIPPATIDGREFVRAHVFSCGACTADEWKIYLEKFEGQTFNMLNSAVGRDDSAVPTPYAILATSDVPAEEHLVANPETMEWVAYSSDAGGDLVVEVRGCGERTAATLCAP